MTVKSLDGKFKLGNSLLFWTTTSFSRVHYHTNRADKLSFHKIKHRLLVLEYNQGAPLSRYISVRVNFFFHKPDFP